MARWGWRHQVERAPPCRTVVGSRAAYGPGCRLRTPGAAAWGGEVTPRGRTIDCITYARPFCPWLAGRRSGGPWPDPQPGHTAVDRERGPRGGPGQRAGQVGNGRGDLVRGDQAAHGLARGERGSFGLRVGRGVEETAHPRGVHGAGVDA